MVEVKAELEGVTEELSGSGPVYEGTMTAPETKIKSAEEYTTYPLTVTATGDNGESTTETKDLYVYGDSLFPMQFILSNPEGEEIGPLEVADIDIDIGVDNDFQIEVPEALWNAEQMWYGYRFFVPDTEYGGLLEVLGTSTKNKTVTWNGYTWRGLLTQKVVEPPEGQENLLLNGELNSVIRGLIGEQFGSLFYVPGNSTGVEVANWTVDRYVTLYDAIMKLLESVGYRLQIAYIEPEGLDYGYVRVEAVPVVDYSDELEYSQDSHVQFSVTDCRNGINHLVCAGTGQNEERIVIHLYVQEDGTIGETQCYFGLDERAAVYDFSSADEEKLREDGTKRLENLRNYKQIKVSVDDMDLELGDIVGGYEQITGTMLKQPITNKILKVTEGKLEIEYKVKGDE